MATLSLKIFPKFSESKEILKIGQSEFLFGGGLLRLGIINRRTLYVSIIDLYSVSENIAEG